MSRVRRSMVFAMPVVAWLGAGAVSALAGSKPTYAPPPGWNAYFKDDKGETKPLQQPVEKNKDKDWMFLQFTDYTGVKNTLAVMRVENKTANVEQAENTKNTTLWTGRVAEVPVAAIEELMTTSLFNTHRYILVERKQLESILAEQDFAASDRAAKSQSAQTGKMPPAQFLIMVAVNAYTPEKGKTGVGGGGIGGGFLGGLGVSKSDAEVSMSFRIVDSSTGQVIDSITAKATAGSWGLGVGAGGYGGGGAGGGALGIERNSPIGYAVQSCINKAVYQIAMKLRDKPWAGSVVKVSSPEKVYLNWGSNAGLATGMSLRALSKGEDLVDPETGMSLGSETTEIGSLQIVSVQDKVSVARITVGCKGLKAGDRVELSQ